MIPALKNFLDGAGWPAERAEPFPADWSARRYSRLRRDGAPAQAILMEAAPDADFRHFIAVDEILRGLAMAAPEIYAAETERGWLILEDFGTRNFGRMMDGGAEALPLLLRAVKSLCLLQRRSLALEAGALPRFDTPRFIALLEPVLAHFDYADAAAARAEWEAAWRKALAPVAALPQALLLRDFMPDNLMDIPARADGQDVGLLDFELAGLGPVAYDLVSLVEQVRRDLPEETRAAVYAAYLAEWPELEAESFLHCARILAVQRHARIFARLKAMNRPDFYLRTLQFLRHQLADPACAGLRRWFVTHLPEYYA